MEIVKLLVIKKENNIIIYINYQNQLVYFIPITTINIFLAIQLMCHCL